MSVYYIGETERECSTYREIKPYDAFSPRGELAGRLLYRSKCRPCSAAGVRRWAKETRAERTKVRHAHSLRSLYGITLADYERMLQEQGGVCAICRGAETSAHGQTGTPYRLSVDHDHETGRIRGLLCQNCNRAIGLLNDDPARLRAAVDYLESGDR